MRVTVTIDLPDDLQAPAKSALPHVRKRLEVVAPIVPASGPCVQWPVAELAVRGQLVRCYHGCAFLGFDLDGRHWLIPIAEIARQVVAAVSPIQIGPFPPAEASTEPPTMNGHHW